MEEKAEVANMQFNEKLKKLRAEKGVSQSELAEKIYVSRSAVAKWENGLGLPSGESLALLAEFFDIEKSELLSDPETANVIINKNHTLSKQKLWIITLVALSCVLIIVAAILIPIALRSSRSTPTLELIYVKELIFETEKNIADLDAKNYTDENISTDKYFAPTRVFTYNSRTTTIILPKVLIKHTIGNQVSYENVNDVSCTVSENCTVRFNDAQKIVFVLATDAPYSAKSEYCINLAVDDMRLSLKIRQEAIQVEKIDLELQSDLPDMVDINSLTEIQAKITPSYATYQAIQYTIDRVIKPDGVPYSGSYTKYANLLISDKIYLRTTPEIDVGAKIYIYAIAEKDQVRSNMLEVVVRRVPIKDIYLETNNDTGNLTVGETCWFRPVAIDEDATFNVTGEQFDVALMTPELAEIEYSKGINTYFITATKDYTKVGKVIKVFVTTPEGCSKSFSWTVKAIATVEVEEVVLVNADTGKELDKEFTIAKGASMRFAIRILPSNATYIQKEFNYSDLYPDYFTFSEEGKIFTVTVSKDAPDSVYECIYADALISLSPYKAVNSKVYTMTIETAPVESIVLKTDTDILVKGGNANLTYEIFPANADKSKIMLSQLQDKIGITYVQGINYNYSVHANYSAIGGSQVSFKVVCGDIESNIVTLTVQKVPVKSVALGIETLKPVAGKVYPLKLAYNLGADTESVEIKLLDQVEGIYFAQNYLFADPNKVAGGTKFRLQAVVNGLASNIINLEVVDSAQPEEVIDLAKSTHYTLNEIYYPNAEGTVLFILLDEIDNAELALVNRFYYGEASFEHTPNLNALIIQSSARTGRIFRVMAIVDGVTDRVFTFKIVDPPEKQSTAAMYAIRTEEFKKKHDF